MLSIGKVTIHWIAQLVSLTVIRGIVIYPLDSATFELLGLEL